MSKFLCIRTCYTPHEQSPPKPKYFKAGEYYDFDEQPPAHFESLESNSEEPANFETDSAELLLDKKWTLITFKKYMVETYDLDMPKKLSKQKAVEKLMYARENANPVIPPPINPV